MLKPKNYRLDASTLAMVAEVQNSQAVRPSETQVLKYLIEQGYQAWRRTLVAGGGQ